ncbi:MAG: hypothetical protein AAB731_04330 [Patescibacteria group bacterium]
MVAWARLAALKIFFLIIAIRILRGLAFAVAFAGTTAAGGCVEEFIARDLPLAIYVDAAFEEDELAAAQSALDEWNEKAASCLQIGEKVFVYEGLYRDADGFKVADLVDGRHTIYKITEETEEIKFLRARYGYEISGYGTAGDALILVNDLPPPMTEDAEHHQLYLDALRRTILHELGHMLMLAHFDQARAIMNTRQSSRVEHLTAKDIEQFCIVYAR